MAVRAACRSCSSTRSPAPATTGSPRWRISGRPAAPSPSTCAATASPIRHRLRSYAPVDLAADIASVVDSLELDRFVLVGHSMGGAAAIAYAGANPDRVAGLVLVGTPGRTPQAQADKVMAALDADYETVSTDYWSKLLTGARPEVEERVLSDMRRVPREPSLAIIRAMFESDPIPALDAYPGPSPADRHAPGRPAGLTPRAAAGSAARGHRRHEPLADARQAAGVRPDPRRVPADGRLTAAGARPLSPCGLRSRPGR